jgi:hypothetical protein
VSKKKNISLREFLMTPFGVILMAVIVSFFCFVSHLFALAIIQVYFYK